MGASDLKGHLIRTTQSANVLRLETRAAAAQPVEAPASTAPAAGEDAAGGDDLHDLLASLDDLVRTQSAEGARPAQASALAPQTFGTPAPSATTPAAGGTLGLAQGIALVNQSHFVAPLNGEQTIWREGTDNETGMRAVVPVSMNSFKLELAPFTVNVLMPGGGAKALQLADVWIRSKHRRSYPGGVILQPEGAFPAGCFNLWQGFGVTPKSGDPSPMIDHVRMLCGGDAALAEYVLDWFALCVQRPGSRTEVALVLRGGRGTGKGTVFRIMLLIFGRHGLHITQPKHLVGNFNSHLRTALFLFADECHWPGDKAAEGVLKGLITEPTIAVEMKGHDVFTAPNRIKLTMASNNDWVIPAGADERRYCVVDVSASRAQDHAYFAALNAWIDGDGAGIFLGYLLGRDLSGFNVRAAPKTAALDRQKIEGMSSLDRWILEGLDTGTGLAGGEWGNDPHRVRCDAALGAFDLYRRRGAARGTPADARAIGRRLGEVFGCGPATVGRLGHLGRVREWTLPGVAQARVSAASAFGLTHYEWGQV